MSSIVVFYKSDRDRVNEKITFLIAKYSMKTVSEFQARLVALEKRMSAIESEQDEIDSLAYRTLTKMDFLHFRYKLYSNHCEKYCLHHI